MRHLSTDTILKFLETRSAQTDSAGAGTAQAGDAASHLSSCARCQEEASELEALVSFLEGDRTNEPDAASLARSLELFQPVMRPHRGLHDSRLLRIARCVFDSYSKPLEGVRTLGVLPRQLLYRAGPVDVDLRIEAAGDRVSLLGQLLSEAGSFPPETEVRLEADGEIRSRTSTNAVGEFSFDEVPSEPFHLALDLPEGEIRLFCVNRPALA